MQAAMYKAGPHQAPIPQAPMSPLPVASDSVGALLTRGYTLPCSTAAQAFQQMVQASARFQVALDALLPILDSPRSELAHRILVSYILYSIYAPHPIGLNPFRSALFDTFVKARATAKDSPNNDQARELEQLVWVLWKILKGDGEDIGPFSPSTLVRSTLPPKLRAANLTLDEEAEAEDDMAATSSDEGREDARYSSPDAHTDVLSQGMTLLLAARERVLTLSEQRLLGPLIPKLTSPSVLTSFDLPDVIAHNPPLAHPLLAALLMRASAKGAAVGVSTYLDVLVDLPPTLPTFDLLGRLLRDATPIRDPRGGNSTIADVVRIEVLGRFIQQSIQWLDDAENDERQGLVSDDRFAKGVQNLCRFYNALLKLGILDPASDTDSVVMIHFTLRQARFEEANALYRTLAVGRF